MYSNCDVLGLEWDVGSGLGLVSEKRWTVAGDSLVENEHQILFNWNIHLPGEIQAWICVNTKVGVVSKYMYRWVEIGLYKSRRNGV